MTRPKPRSPASIAEFRKAFADMDVGADTLDSAIDLSWTMFDSPTCVAWVKLRIAARTDRVLAAPVVEMDRRFGETGTPVDAR